MSRRKQASAGLEEPTQLKGRAPKRAPRPSSQRKYLTPRERRWLWSQQDGKCGCGCKRKIDWKTAIGEHTTPVALGNNEKPDALYLEECAEAKTYGKPGRVGGDIRDIAHTRRIAEGRTQHDKRLKRGPLLRSNEKIVNRGFRKDVRRRMDGTTELVR